LRQADEREIEEKKRNTEIHSKIQKNNNKNRQDNTERKKKEGNEEKDRKLEREVTIPAAFTPASSQEGEGMNGWVDG